MNRHDTIEALHCLSLAMKFDAIIKKIHFFTTFEHRNLSFDAISHHQSIYQAAA